MAKLAAMVASFVQSPSGDVVANRVRILEDAAGFSYGAPHDQVPAPAPDPDGRSRIDLATLPQAQGIEGRRDVWITAVDSRARYP